MVKSSMVCLMALAPWIMSTVTTTKASGSQGLSKAKVSTIILNCALFIMANGNKTWKMESVIKLKPMAHGIKGNSEMESDMAKVYTSIRKWTANFHRFTSMVKSRRGKKSVEANYRYMKMNFRPWNWTNRDSIALI